MLTGESILEKIQNGEIRIEPFNRNQINPNSYNLRLAPTLKTYAFDADETGELVPLDSKRPNKFNILTIPEEGLVLYPGTLYLGSTIEKTACENLVPCIDGRSSIARLGINIHITAGFGDVGFKGNWTLEITVVHPVIVYPNMEICQIYFEEITGGTGIRYHGKYQNQDGPQESRLYEEYIRK